MSATSTPDPVERVVAWHNSHPLALRIGRQHVVGLGWLALPFAAARAQGPDAAPAAGAVASLRERAMALAQPAVDAAMQPTARAPEVAEADRAKLIPAFSEDLMPPLRPRAIARFALDHGRREEPMDPRLPRRQAQVDARLVPPGNTVHWLYLPTAAVEDGARRQRVLIAAGAEAEVLGRRLIGRVRLAVIALVVGASALAVALLWQGWDHAASGAPAPTGAAFSASAAAASGAVPANLSAPPALVASAPAPLSSAGSAPSAIPPTTPSSGPASLPPPTSTAAPSLPDSVPPGKTESTATIRPRLDPELARAARAEAAALRAASAAGVATAPSAVAAPGKPAASSALASAASATTLPMSSSPSAAAGPIYALVARTTRSRAASAILLSAMTAEAGRDGKPPRAEVLSAEGGYRAGLWPFANREQAQRTQQRLREAGLETELVSF